MAQYARFKMWMCVQFSSGVSLTVSYSLLQVSILTGRKDNFFFPLEREQKTARCERSVSGFMSGSHVMTTISPHPQYHPLPLPSPFPFPPPPPPDQGWSVSSAPPSQPGLEGV